MNRARPGRLFLLATASLASILPGALLAQEGTGLRGNFSFATGLEFSDNKRLDPESLGDTTTWFTDLGFGVLSETRTERLTFSIDGRFEQSFGDGATDEDDFRLSGSSANFGYNRVGANSRLRLFADYSFREIEDDFLGFFVDGEFDPQALLIDGGEVDRRRIGGTVETGIEGPFGLEVNFTARDRNYRENSDPDLTDQTRVNLDGIARFRTRPNLTFRALAGLERQEDTSDLSTLVEESEVDFIGFGLETETAGGLSIVGDVLVDDSETIVNGSTSNREDGVGFDISLLQDRPNGTIGANFTSRIDGAGRRITASVSRAVEFPTGGLSFSLGLVDQEDGDTGFTTGLGYLRETTLGRVTANLTQSPSTDIDEAFLNTSFDVGLARELSPVSEIGATFRYGRSRGISGTDDDIDTRTTFGITYQRDLTEDWGLTAGYEYTRTDDEGSPSADRNTLFFNIGRDFDFGF